MSSRVPHRLGLRIKDLDIFMEEEEERREVKQMKSSLVGITSDAIGSMIGVFEQLIHNLQKENKAGEK